MKLSTQKLKQIIKEELKRVLNENYTFKLVDNNVIATGSSYADRELSFSPEEFLAATPSEYVKDDQGRPHMEIEVDGGPGTVEIPIEKWQKIKAEIGG